VCLLFQPPGTSVVTIIVIARKTMGGKVGGGVATRMMRRRRGTMLSTIARALWWTTSGSRTWCQSALQGMMKMLEEEEDVNSGVSDKGGTERERIQLMYVGVGGLRMPSFIYIKDLTDVCTFVVCVP
jgi:hypothetical protein